jgi:hypothetical protein
LVQLPVGTPTKSPFVNHSPQTEDYGLNVEKSGRAVSDSAYHERKEVMVIFKEYKFYAKDRCLQEFTFFDRNLFKFIGPS